MSYYRKMYPSFAGTDNSAAGSLHVFLASMAGTSVSFFWLGRRLNENL